MAPSEHQSVAALTIDSHIPLNTKVDLECEDGDSPGKQSSDHRKLSRHHQLKVCCPISFAFFAAVMVGLFVVGPFIKLAIAASNGANQKPGQSIGKFMSPMARPLASLVRPAAMSPMVGHEISSVAAPSSRNPSAGGRNGDSELKVKELTEKWMQTEVKDLRDMLGEQKRHHTKIKETMVAPEPTSGYALIVFAFFLAVFGAGGVFLHSIRDRFVAGSSRQITGSCQATVAMSEVDTTGPISTERSFAALQIPCVTNGHGLAANSPRPRSMVPAMKQSDGPEAKGGGRHCVPTLSRRGLLAAAAPLALLPRVAAAVEESDSTPVDGENFIQGVLQTKTKLSLPPTAETAVISCRVPFVGVLATVTVPIDKGFPVPFTIRKSDLKEGITDSQWAAEDVYVRADVVLRADVIGADKDKVLITGRSKAKAVDGPAHLLAYVTME